PAPPPPPPAPGELATEVVVPPRSAGWRDGFLEVARRQGDFALAGPAACARGEADIVRDCGLGFFGVGATPARGGAGRPPCRRGGGPRRPARAGERARSARGRPRLAGAAASSRRRSAGPRG